MQLRYSKDAARNCKKKAEKSIVKYLQFPRDLIASHEGLKLHETGILVRSIAIVFALADVVDDIATAYQGTRCHPRHLRVVRCQLGQKVLAEDLLQIFATNLAAVQPGTDIGDLAEGKQKSKI